MAIRTSRHLATSKAAGVWLLGWLSAACTSTTIAERPRLGLALGQRFTAVCVDREEPIDDDPSLTSDDGLGGFLELMADDPGTEFHLRLVGQKGEHRVTATATTATVTEGLALGLLSPLVPIGDTFVLKPLIGFGFGYTDIDLDPLLALGDRSGPTVAIAAGAELEVADHAYVGAMGWVSFLGKPGDTEGRTDTLLLYVGVRF